MASILAANVESANRLAYKPRQASVDRDLQSWLPIQTNATVEATRTFRVRRATTQFFRAAAPGQ